MKNILIFLLIGIPVCCIAQPRFTPENDTTSVEMFLLDFTVPDMPAFKALDINPSEILRPSDIKKFAIMLQPFVSEGKAVIPRSFALEVAPFKLMESEKTGPKLSIADYTNARKPIARLLYTTSISIGSVRKENDQGAIVNKLSFGLRTSFTGKRGNILKDTAFQNAHIYKALKNVQSLRNEEEKKWIRENKLSPSEMNEGEPQRKAFDEYFATTFVEELKTTKIKQAVDAYNKYYWNASRGELAIAWVGQSPDSLLTKVSFASFDIWGVWALRVKSHGQLLLGGHLQRPKSTFNEEGNSSKAISITLNTRFYYGTKNFRCFGEYQFKNNDGPEDKRLGLVNLGSELRVMKDFWVVLSGGVENVYDDSKSRFVSSLDIRYSFNKVD